MAGRPVVGLDVGTSAVRAAEVTPGGRRGATLRRFGQVALPSGAVRNGEVVDPAAVADALKLLWSQAQFPSKKVALGVANQKVVVRQIELPWLPRGELRASLPFQVQDVLPMPVESALLDVHRLEEFTTATGARMLRVLLVAAARDMVESLLSAVDLAGLYPVSVDVTGFAVLRALAHGETGIASVTSDALLDIGESITNLVVHQGGVPLFLRILVSGGGDITDAVAERMGVPIEQAESVKQQTVLAANGEMPAADPASRVVEASVDAFVEEVRGSLDYFSSQSDAGRIGRLVLSGGGSRLAGLPERLAAATRLDVDLARPTTLLTVGRTGLTGEQLDEVESLVVVPVGLALGATS